MSFASSNIQASLLALAKCTTNMLFVQILDLISSAVLPASCLHAPSGSHSGHHAATDGSGLSKPFVAYQPDFLKLLAAPALSVLCHSEDGLPLFHEAGKSDSGQDLVFFTSNLAKEHVRVDGGGMASGLVRLTKVVIPQVAPEKPLTTGWTDLPLSQTYPAANGAFLFGHHLLLCDQGYGTGQPSSLVLVDSRAPHKATTLLNNFHGRRFNSLNDVVVHSAPGRTHSRDTSHPLIGHRAKGDPYETIWFTDPHYASEQGFKDAPELPAQAYCFDPWTGNIRAVGDQFTKPNGIAFDATGTTCYITDTGMIRGDGVINGHLPGSIYAYDVVFPPPTTDPTVAGPQLANRRLFAFTDSGAPDGIKLDRDGNVYAGCFDGIHVWNKFGTLLGKILLTAGGEPPDGCANFCFVPGGRIVGLAEDKMYLVEGLAVEGALL